MLALCIFRDGDTEENQRNQRKGVACRRKAEAIGEAPTSDVGVHVMRRVAFIEVTAAAFLNMGVMMLLRE